MLSIEQFPGWAGEVSHAEAESLLIGKREGTYILRHGDFITHILEDNLSDENEKDMHCFILTVVEQNQKIEDILLIQSEDVWLLYHDDPDLIHDPYPSFSTLQELLDSLQTKAKYPLIL